MTRDIFLSGTTAGAARVGAVVGGELFSEDEAAEEDAEGWEGDGDDCDDGFNDAREVLFFDRGGFGFGEFGVVGLDFEDEFGGDCVLEGGGDEGGGAEEEDEGEGVELGFAELEAADDGEAEAEEEDVGGDVADGGEGGVDHVVLAGAEVGGVPVFGEGTAPGEGGDDEDHKGYGRVDADEEEEDFETFGEVPLEVVVVGYEAGFDGPHYHEVGELGEEGDLEGMC